MYTGVCFFLGRLYEKRGGNGKHDVTIFSPPFLMPWIERDRAFFVYYCCKSCLFYLSTTTKIPSSNSLLLFVNSN